MQKVKVNSVLKLYTLCLLSKGSKHGYELIKELENKMDQSISASHVYPFLKTLEENKFIVCKSIDKRDKKSYDLTKNGEEFIELVFEKLGGVIDAAIQNKLSTCVHCRCKIYGESHKEKIKNTTHSFCCKHCAKAFKEEMLLNV